MNVKALKASGFSPDTVCTSALQLVMEEVKDLLVCADTRFETSELLPLTKPEPPTNLTGQSVCSDVHATEHDGSAAG